MKKLIYIAVLLVLAVSSGLSQASGTVTVSSIGVVTAEATLPSEPVRCTFQKVNFGRPSILIFCYVSGIVSLYQLVEPVSGVAGSPGVFMRFPNVVQWTLQQPSPGVFTWNIGANGVMSSGTFQ